MRRAFVWYDKFPLAVLPAGARARRCAALGTLSGVTLAALCGVGSVVAAEEETGSSNTGVDVQVYRPSTTANGIFGLEPSSTLEPRASMFGLSFNYGQQLLRIDYPDGSAFEDVDIVSSQAITHLHGGYGVLPWLEVGGSLPFAVMQTSRNPDTGAEGTSQTLGDISLYARAELLRQHKASPGVAISLPISLPTGDEAAYLGEPGISASPMLSIGQNNTTIGWTTMVGYRIRPDTSLVYAPAGISLPLGNELLYGVGADAQVSRGLRIGGALEGRLGATGDAGANPLEGRVGVRYGLPSGLIFHGGGAFAISGGYGVPTYRFFAGVDYALGGRGFWRPDQDGDGLGDASDKCPTQAEDLDSFLDGDGCPDPDNDGDAVLDAVDKCPGEPETVNSVADEDGCPESDRDVDGLTDEADQCPDRPEDRDDFQDSDGCPEEDNDEDGLADPADKCPVNAEDVDGFEDSDGCPDPDNDGDTVLDLNDACPAQSEDLDGTSDADGCPDPDNDGDGIPDVADRCPNVAVLPGQKSLGDGCPAEGGSLGAVAKPPVETGETEEGAEEDPLRSMTEDTDGDKIADGLDACPRKPETYNGYRDKDGCPEKDTDNDLIVDARDKCPKLPETVNGYRDQDGCPEKDTDQDGLPDPIDRCPKLAEVINQYKDGDGCPDEVDTSAAPDGAAGAPAQTSKDAAEGASIDADNDGITGRADLCPKKPETYNGIDDEDGCPEKDTDEDGIIDQVDQCPKVPEWVNGFKDTDGCPEWDSDKDGIFDALDDCPKQAETVNGIDDKDGCPETDGDRDGVLDPTDKCPAARETANGFEDADGCPDVAPRPGMAAPAPAPQ